MPLAGFPRRGQGPVLAARNGLRFCRRRETTPAGRRGLMGKPHNSGPRSDVVIGPVFEDRMEVVSVV